MRNSMNTAAAAVDRYLNTSYDIVKVVYDNMKAIVGLYTMLDDYQVAALSPLVRSDGDPLQLGDRWYSSANNTVYTWNGTAWKAVAPPALLIIDQVFVSVANETVVTIPGGFTYVVGSGSLKVSINGLPQMLGASYAYTETSTTSITFTQAITTGDVVLFTITKDATLGN